jgi:hypothetical protein
MCSVCVYTAAAGVTGLRAWLQTRRWNWLTRRRLRGVTVAVMIMGLAAATVTL